MNKTKKDKSKKKDLEILIERENSVAMLSDLNVR
jgi:hypothetical protein